MFAVLNVETGGFYSVSSALKKEARHAGMPWDHRSILQCFARPYSRYRDALRQSQKLSGLTGCMCAVVPLEMCKAGR